MKMIFLISLALILANTQSNCCFAQQSKPQHFDSLIVIQLKDGSSIYAVKIDSSDRQQLRIRTSSMGTITIPRDSVQSVSSELYDRMTHQVWFANPNSTRYFFSPSAIPLRKGEGYFQNAELFFCMVNYGVTKNISLGGGMDILTPFIAGSGGPIALGNIKAAFMITNKFYAAANVLVLRMPAINLFDDETGSDLYTMPYGLLTYGTPDYNVTAGGGYSLKNGNSTPGPLFTLSAMVRVSPRFCFLSENWIVPSTSENGINHPGQPVVSISYPAIFGYGVRFMGPKIAVDLGFVNNKDIANDIFIGIPYVDFVVKFH